MSEPDLQHGSPRAAPPREARTAAGAARPGEAAHGDAEKPMEARTAGSPARSAALPPLSDPLWKRVWTKFNNDDVMNQAAKVAYYFFMSLPSLLLAVFSLAGVVGDERNAEWLSTTLQANLPSEGAALVGGFVSDVVRKNHPAPLSIGLLLALWFGTAVFISLEDTLNTAYAVTCGRSFARRVGVALMCMVAVGGLLTGGSLAVLAGPVLARALGLGAVWTVLQWPLGFALVVAALWVIYYVLPSRDQSHCKLTLLKASCFAAALFLAAGLLFRLYAAHFGSYGRTYGVLGGIIVLLLWMYYTSMAILLGGELASEMERGG